MHGGRAGARNTFFAVRDYDLAATLTSGQAFRWSSQNNAWTGVVRGRWVRLCGRSDGVRAETVAVQPDWNWLANYLQVEVNLEEVLATFPKDPQMTAAMSACGGLRLLRQEPWECLASFILSSTKQIVQIRQIVAALCECFGDRVATPAAESPAWTFPSPKRIAAATEAELRRCKMGFRAPYLLETARLVANGDCDLVRLGSLSVEEARETLMTLPGVGEKVANCTLLFAYGFPTAFPVDVWVARTLRQLYFRGRHVSESRLRAFAREYFGPHGGYAQQYLFHHARLNAEKGLPKAQAGR